MKSLIINIRDFCIFFGLILAYWLTAGGGYAQLTILMGLVKADG